MKWILCILFLMLLQFGYSQTVIEMTSPEDAQIILLEVQDSIQADIFIYKTKKKSESKEWDCVWKFKKFGFSNFEIFIAKDEKELFVASEESLSLLEDRQYIPHGKIYFVSNKEYRGYKKGFALEGMMKVTQTRKMKIRKNDLE